METLAYLLVSQGYESQDDLAGQPERLETPLTFSNLAAVKLLSLSCAAWLLGLSSGAIAQTYESDGLYPSSIYAFTADRAYSDYYRGDSVAYLLPEDSIYAGDAYSYVRPNGQSSRAIAPCPYSTADSVTDSATSSTTGYVTIAPASSLQMGGLQLGDSGAQVRSLQELLRNAGYFSSTSTGYFGSATEAAVIAFQQDYGLMVDGVAGAQTIAALQS
jgi:Putative peptidoglycan binding domain